MIVPNGFKADLLFDVVKFYVVGGMNNWKYLSWLLRFTALKVCFETQRAHYFCEF
jgi:hypothetical protein